MRSLATLTKRVAAIETKLRIEPVPLQVVHVVNLLASIDASAQAAVKQLTAYLMELHSAGVCPAGCRCQPDQAGRRFCAVRSPMLSILVYIGPMGTISAESALGTFETNFKLEGKRCEHGSLI